MLLLLQASAKLRYPKKTKILNNGARGDREIPDENESPVRDLSNELVYFSGMPSCGDINYTCDKQVLWERANFFFRVTTLSFQTASRIIQTFLV